MRLAIAFLITFLCLFSNEASAEPVTAALTAWYAVVGFWGAAAVVAQYAAVIYSVASTIQAGKTADYNQRKARDEYNAGLKDRMATRVSNDAPHKYIYGEAKVGSDIVAVFTSGDKDQYKHLVCVHAAHECTEISSVWVAGKRLGALDAGGWVTSDPSYLDDYGVAATQPFYTGETNNYSFDVNGSNFFTLAYTPVAGSIHVTTTVNDYGNYTQTSNNFIMNGLNGYTSESTNFTVTYQSTQKASRVRVKKHLGFPNQSADTDLIAAVPTKWDTYCQLKGLCYTIITLDLNQTEFQGGLPSVEVLIKGKKIYDPRYGTTTYKNNPALVLYDYLQSPLCKIPVADLPISSYITAANVCDDVYSNGGSHTYNINGVITSSQSQIKVIESIAQAMAGGVVATTWDCYAGKYIAPVKSLTQEDIVGSLTVTPSMSDASISNGVKGQYLSKANKYVSTDFTPYSNATYVAADGSEAWLNMDFPFTDNLQQVHNLCRIFLEDQRNSFTIKATFSLKAWDLKVGERISFTSAFLGQTSKVYRIISKSFSPTNAVELTLKEDAASIWDAADTTLVDDTPNTNLKDPFSILPITNLQCASGTDVLLVNSDGTISSRILVTWAAVPDDSVTTVEIFYQPIGGGDTWIAYNTSDNDVSAYLPNVRDGLIYNIRVRRINPYMNIKSDWVYTTHKVIGKTQPPPDVSRFKVIEQPSGIRQYFWGLDNPPADLFSYEVRYSLGTIVRPWDQMITLFAKDRDAVQNELTEPRGDGVYTIAIVAIDTTGNRSINPFYITSVFDTGAFGTVYKIVLPYQTYWQGIKTSCYLDDNNTLVNNGSFTWGDLTPSWGTTSVTWGNTPSSPIVYEHTVVDLGTVISTTIRANSLVSGSTVVEMSTSDDNITYSPFGTIPSGATTHRYYKFRFTVSGANPIMYRTQIVFYT